MRRQEKRGGCPPPRLSEQAQLEPRRASAALVHGTRQSRASRALSVKKEICAEVDAPVSARAYSKHWVCQRAPIFGIRSSTGPPKRSRRRAMQLPPDCIAVASRIALPGRDGWPRAGTLHFHSRHPGGSHAGDLQHPDYGRVLRLAAGLQAAVRRSQAESGLPPRRGGPDQRGGLPRAPAGQGPQGPDRDRTRASCRAR